MSDKVTHGRMPPVRARFECGDQRLDSDESRCGLIVLPAGPEGTVQMHMQAAGTDRDVVLMGVAVVEYVLSLGLGAALIRAIEEVDEIEDLRVSVVRAHQYDGDPDDPPTTPLEG